MLGGGVTVQGNVHAGCGQLQRDGLAEILAGTSNQDPFVLQLHRPDTHDFDAKKALSGAIHPLPSVRYIGKRKAQPTAILAVGGPPGPIVVDNRAKQASKKAVRGRNWGLGMASREN